MVVNIKTLVDAFTTKVNDQDDVDAAHVNALQSALKQLATSGITETDFKNVEALTTTKNLTDDDFAYQFYTVNSGNQDIKLPDISNQNHPFVIQHVGESNTITVKTFAGASVLSLGAGDYIILLPMNGTWKYFRTGFDPYFNIQVVIGDGISVVTTGIKGDLEVPYNCQVVGWTILEGTGTAGSIVVDVWKDIYANFPPTVGDTITGSEKPTLSSAIRNQDLTLTSWTTTLNKGDVLRFNVDSAASLKQVTVCLKCKRV